MTNFNEKTFDLTNAVETALDKASRDWRLEYYHMPMTQVASERRDRAIRGVQDAIEWFAEDTIEPEQWATVIVDNSEFAIMGFDAQNTMPHTAFGRWFARWF